ncbi:hypothetical protein E8E12_001867 [Didymella heteroderae]|uniref:Uncharacterized protein n=1 Tax=Didymella heteroderae TaxID=1769908 RepID=A0A9P4WX73_9PLEO|nr:hypothetical protein E8E12_001867 [Didymella heteroderae]
MPLLGLPANELAPVAEEGTAPPSTVSRASSPAPALPSLLTCLFEQLRGFFGGIFGALFSRWRSPTCSLLLPVTSPLASPLSLPTDPAPSPPSPPPLGGLSFILTPAPPTPSMGGSAKWPSTMATSAQINIPRSMPRDSH